ncbi:MAG: hypothetical protein U0235_27860 [Polyangiaceae bacterium]
MLEGAGLAADLHEHLEAIEGALALAHRLELIGGLLEHAHRRDQRLA